MNASCPTDIFLSPFYVIEEKEWVHVVAINAQGEFLLTRQYRYPARMVCSELPCGCVDEGEEPLAAAQRELGEETGFVAGQWTPFAVFHANPARQTNRVHCFLARQLTLAGPPSLDDSEDITCEFAKPAEVMRRIRAGDFAQGLHVASYLLALESLREE